jgi:cytochrome c553
MTVIRTTRYVALTLSALFLLGLNAVAAPPLPPDHAERLAKGTELFTKQVRAILIENCLKCHGGQKTQKGFDLSTRELLLKGSENGSVVELWRAKDSRLVDLIGHKDIPYMPSKEDKLSDDKIAKIAEWIDLGAPYDKPLLVPAAQASACTKRQRRDLVPHAGGSLHPGEAR